MVTFKHRVLAGKIRVVFIRVGEGDLHVEGLAGRMADDLREKSSMNCALPACTLWLLAVPPSNFSPSMLPE